MTTIDIFSPLGRPKQTTSSERLAIPDLRGTTIGVLENTKPGAREVLERIAERVADAFGASEVIVERKGSAAEGAPPDMIRRLSGAAHLVFAGSGD